MNLFLIDAIGPFFPTYHKRKINWSKLPFEDLPTTGQERQERFSTIRRDMCEFTSRVSAIGYNAVTLDDVGHLTDHPWYEDEVREKIRVYANEFRHLFKIIQRSDLSVYITMDIFSSTSELQKNLAKNHTCVDDFLADLLDRFFNEFPEVAGVILRIGESDGVDVTADFRSKLHIKSPNQLNSLLRRLLPVFDNHRRKLILRTWTVGAYRIGDLIWHRDTLSRALNSLDSPALILSMKHGESDFFRYLPLNRNFFRTDIPKIIELQTKREYEGCGEFPSFIGFDHERFARELQSADNMIGISVWCQTGGWIPFRRLAYIGDGSLWTELNSEITIDIFRYGLSVEQSIRKHPLSRNNAAVMMEFLRLSDEVIRELYYQQEFAQQKLFFRRVRIPPIIGVYWHTIFINHSLRKVLRYFVKDPESCIRAGRQALVKIERMEALAVNLNLPVSDIEFMYDTMSLLALARDYYYLPFDEKIKQSLISAKKRYKKKYPRRVRQRYAVRLNFERFRIKKIFINWAMTLMLRRKRGYRLIDQIFTIHLLSYIFRFISSRRARWIPKFARKSAMGIDTIFR